MLIIFLFFILSVSSLFDAEEYDEVFNNNYDHDYSSASIELNSPQDLLLHDQQSQGNHKIGYSAGSGLRSIAEGSLNSAKNAVNSQDAAGHQAAYMAKQNLAQQAAGASATAQAALAGKMILLQGLEQQLYEAQQSLMGEKQQLMQAERSADSTMKAAQEAREHVNVLQATLNAAQQAADTVTQAASEAAGELAAQQAMVGAAKQRVETLKKQLSAVRIDYEATRNAAMKAQAAAQEAAANAAAAAAAAAKDLTKSVSKPAPPPPPPPPPPPHKGKNDGHHKLIEDANLKYLQNNLPDDAPHPFNEDNFFNPLSK